MNGVSDSPLVLELLPARHGDALLVTWGPPHGRHRLLVDGGPASAYPDVRERLRESVPDAGIDLLVLTHIDADHIEGTLMLANDAALNLDIGEFWFNGPAQVAPTLGTAQGEMLAALIGARGIPLNGAFGHRAIRTPDDGPLPVIDLDGGMSLTVLGPDRDSLRALQRVWLPTFQDQGLVFASEDQALDALRARSALNPATTFLSGGPERLDMPRLLAAPIVKDTSPPNRSSIVLLAEYAGNAVLLAGDATPTALTEGVRRLLAERGLEHLDLAAFKLPHHGSRRNLTPELLQLLPADSYLFSSDGGKFGHPDDEAVARCLAYGKRESTLVFNYRNSRTIRWNDDSLLGPGAQRTRYPSAGEDGVTWSMLAGKQVA